METKITYGNPRLYMAQSLLVLLLVVLLLGGTTFLLTSATAAQTNTVTALIVADSLDVQPAGDGLLSLSYTLAVTDTPTPTPTPSPTATVPPGDCDPHPNPLAYHSEWLENPCDGAPAHSHEGESVPGYECPFDVPPSGDDDIFGNWREKADMPEDIDFGGAYSTVGEIEKAHGYNKFAGCGLPRTNSDTTVWITDFWAVNHRVNMTMANYVRFHSALLLARFSNGTTLVYTGWQDTGHLHVNSEVVPLRSDTWIDPPDGSQSFEVPCLAVPHPEGGAGRFGIENNDGELLPSGFWYNLNPRCLENRAGFEIGMPAEMTSAGRAAPHIIAIFLPPSFAAGGHWDTDVYGCLTYGECGNYWLPDDKQAAGVLDVSDYVRPGYWQLRIDNGQITHNIGPGDDTAQADYFSAVYDRLGYLESASKPVVTPLPVKPR